MLSTREACVCWLVAFIVSNSGLTGANSAVHPSRESGEGECSGNGGWRAVSRATSQVPKTLSADHLRRKERKKEGEGEEQRGKETFLKQNTKT